jgi:pimeloyl-ACP methyl ester carboxylesterase
MGTGIGTIEPTVAFFVWLEDPVSGSHQVNYLKERLPKANIVGLEAVGHYPQTEVPDTVAFHLRKIFLGDS